MCRLQNMYTCYDVAMCDYQESVTVGQSDAYVLLCFTGDTKRM